MMNHCCPSWLKANSLVDLPAVSQALEKNGFSGCAGPFQITRHGPKLDLSGLADGHGALTVRPYDIELGLAIEGGFILEAYVNVYENASNRFLIDHTIPQEHYPAFMDLFQAAVTDTLQGYRSQSPSLASSLGELVRPRNDVAPAIPCPAPVAA